MFTLNNPSGFPTFSLWVDKIVKEKLFPFTDKRIAYSRIAVEVGESGTQHLQGYIYFNSAQRGAAVAKLLQWTLTGAYIVPAKKKSAATYPGREEKSGTVEGCVEFGELDSVGQGSRNDIKKEDCKIQEILDCIENGESDYYILKKYPGTVARHFRAIDYFKKVIWAHNKQKK